MYDTVVTMLGNVLTEPEWRRTAATNTYVVTFRFASTSRRYDRTSERWVDGDSLRLRVACWRKLGENTIQSIQVGDPLIVYGRLFSRDWVDSEGQRRTSYELDAVSVGHDLARGVSRFVRRKAAGAVTSIEDAESDETIGGERTELLATPERPSDMPSSQELYAGFNPELYETSEPGPGEPDAEDELDDDCVEEDLAVAV